MILLVLSSEKTIVRKLIIIFIIKAPKLTK